MMKNSRTFIAAVALAAGGLAGQAGAQAPQRPAPPKPVAAAAVPETAPASATGRCRDGSYTTGESVSEDCAARGGMLVAFPVKQTPRRSVAPTSAPSLVTTPQAPIMKAPAGDALPAAPVAASPAVPERMAPQSAAPVKPVLAAAAPAMTLVAPRPSNATGQCKDGSYIVGAAVESACGANGGLAVAFPVDRKPGLAGSPSLEQKAAAEPRTTPQRGKPTPAKRPARRTP